MFLSRTRLPEGFEDRTWNNVLAPAISDILTKGDLSPNVHRADLARLAETLYRHNVLPTSKIAAAVNATYARLAADGKTMTASAIDDVWQKCTTAQMDFAYIFMAHDAIRTNPLSRMIVQEAFKTTLFAPNKMLLFSALNEIALGLRTESTMVSEVQMVERALHGRLLSMLQALGEYAAYEASLVEILVKHYSSITPPVAIVPWVSEALELEEALAKNLLPPASHRSVLLALEGVLVKERILALLACLQNDAVLMEPATLSTLFRLCHRVDQMDALKAAWKTLLRQVGVKATASIIEVLELKTTVDAACQGPFQRHPAMTDASQEAFEYFLNQGNTGASIAAQLSRHLDGLLRHTTSDSPGQLPLECPMAIFRMLHCKDVFETCYKRDLSRRLLSHRPASAELEAAVLDAMQRECGHAFTSRMEGMFRDYHAWPALNRSFSGKKASVVHFAITTAGIWPSVPMLPNVTVAAPEVQKAMDAFSKHYLDQHRHRRLQWSPFLSHVELRVRFDAGEKVLVCSALQASLLMQFTYNASPSFKQLKTTLKANEEAAEVYLGRALQGLIALGVLSKTGANMDIRSSDSFAFNASFTHALYRIKVPGSHFIEDTSIASTTMDVDMLSEVSTTMDVHSLQYQLDAAIVRYVKMKQSVPIAELLTQVEPIVSRLTLSSSLTPEDAMIERVRLLAERDFVAVKGDAIVYLP